MTSMLGLTAIVLLAAASSDPVLPDFPLGLPDRPDWWRREVPRGRPVDANLEKSLTAAFGTLPTRDWGRALAEPGGMSLWDLGASADGLRHVGFRGYRRFTNGADPGEWEGILVFNPDAERILMIEAWPLNQAALSAHRLGRYRRSIRLTLDLDFFLPLGRTKPPPRVRDLRMVFLEDGSVLKQERSAKLKSSSGPARPRTRVTITRANLTVPPL